MLGQDERGARLPRGVTRRLATAGFVGLALAATLAIASCRQILGLETDPPLASTSSGSGGQGAGGSGGAGGLPSPFDVVSSNPAGESLYAIWGTPGGFYVAVGSATVSYFWKGDGAMTRLGGQTQGRDYTAVWGTSETDIFAVGLANGGGTGFIAHYDGNAWTEVHEEQSALFGVWGTKDAVGPIYYACGTNGLLLRSYDGLTWKPRVKFPTGPDDPKGAGQPILLGMSGRSDGDWAIAAESRIIHNEPDAGVYAFYEPHGISGTIFRSAWQAPIPTTALYFGTNYYGLTFFTADKSKGFPLAVLSRDEKTPGAEKAFTRAVWGTAAKVVFVGDDGHIATYDTGSQKVSLLGSPTSDSLNGVWGTKLDDVWIVGAHELILHGSVK